MAARARVARAAGRHRHVHGRRLARRSSATVRSWSSGSPRPAEHDPAELSDPRHFAYWRRAADVVTVRHRGRDARAARAARRVGRGGRRRASPSSRTGSRTPPTAGCSPRTRWAGSPAPTSATRPGWPATSCATGWRGSSAGAAGRRWPGPRSPTSPTHLWRRRDAVPRRSSTRSPRCPSTATRCRPTSRAARATRWSPSTGGCSATGRSAPTSATTCSRRARSSSRCWTPT